MIFTEGEEVVYQYNEFTSRPRKDGSTTKIRTVWGRFVKMKGISAVIELGPGKIRKTVPMETISKKERERE